MEPKEISPVIICEGYQEMEFAQQLCKNFKIGINILHLSANGSYKYNVIARKINDLVNSLEFQYFPIIVLFDRENNKDSLEQITHGVREELTNLGLDADQFILGIANRSVESWILPFVDEDGRYPIDPTGGSDGKRCLGMLKRRLRKRGILYKKTQSGVEILSKIDPNKLATVSASFRKFYNQTKKYCDW